MKIVRSLARNAIGLAGMASITFGVEQYSRPAGFVVAGMFLILCALVDAFETRPAA
jgi:hypothetical protein